MVLTIVISVLVLTVLAFVIEHLITRSFEAQYGAELNKLYNDNLFLREQHARGLEIERRLVFKIDELITTCDSQAETLVKMALGAVVDGQTMDPSLQQKVDHWLDNLSAFDALELMDQA